MLTALEKIESLSELERSCFSGQVYLTDSADQKWTFYLFKGQILYVTGGIHPVRRWRKNLIAFCPKLPTYRLAWQVELAKIDDSEFVFGWEYALLNRWVMQRKITAQQASKVLHGVVVDALFELMQATKLTSKTEPNDLFIPRFELVDVQPAIAIAEQRWSLWQSANLTGCFSTQAPIIKQSEQVKYIAARPECQDLVGKIDGQHSLYELAAETRRDVLDVVKALLPFVSLGWIELSQIGDLPAPIYRQRLFRQPSLPLPTEGTQFKGALIACVDDSAFVRNLMQQMLTSAGYQFVGIEEPMRAIGTLLSRKPDLIFLDLMMPHIGGYELCEQLRKLSCFKQTPIVILTGNDGFVNRLRSDFVGASDFLAKPLDEVLVLGVIHKHLTKKAVSSP